MILFITPYPKGTAASQRFRFEQYLPVLKNKGIKYEISPFWEEKAWCLLYQKRKYLAKIFYVIKGYIRRLSLVYKCFKYDYIFIHREIYPAGSKFLIFVLTKILNRKIIYDFDDAIWLPNFANNNKRFAFIKSYGQVKYLCKYAYKVSVGNEYLKEFAFQYNSNVFINPTTIDTENLHNKAIDYNYTDLKIGWTGTHSTLKYTKNLLPILDELYLKYQFTLVIISDQVPNFKREYLKFVKWNKKTEIDDLLQFSVGIMPLNDDQWAKGKCGFKALQYMSLGIPAIVSPVGVNTKIVDHEKNGWICDSDEEWKITLENILINHELAKETGKRARQKIIENYSVQSNTTNFLNLFS